MLHWRLLQALAAAGVLLKEESYAHKYPYDWRTKKPTIFRATDQVGTGGEAGSRGSCGDLLPSALGCSLAGSCRMMGVSCWHASTPVW